MKNTDLKRYIHLFVHCSTIYNYDISLIKCPSRMNGYRICDIYTQDICNGILFNHRKESNIGIYDKMDGFKRVSC